MYIACLWQEEKEKKDLLHILLLKMYKWIILNDIKAEPFGVWVEFLFSHMLRID